MLSIEQLTIVAYATGGGILCRKCGEKERLPMSDALCAYTVEFPLREGFWAILTTSTFKATYGGSLYRIEHVRRAL